MLASFFSFYCSQPLRTNLLAAKIFSTLGVLNTGLFLRSLFCNKSHLRNYYLRINKVGISFFLDNFSNDLEVCAFLSGNERERKRERERLSACGSK